MRKLLILGTAFLVSVTMLLIACKKDDPKPDNSGNNNNQETYGGGGESGEDGEGEGEVLPNQEYPETAVVLPQAVTDIDGNTYDAVQIGNQVWMAENLRTTKYADGTTIPLGSPYSFTEPYRYAPGPNQSNNENLSYVAHYGYLYNWSALMHGASSSDANPSRIQGVCPNGWHVPSDSEWTQLTAYVGSHSEYVCNGSVENIAKALASNNGWQLFNGIACAVGNNPSTNNATGFSALPAGDYGGSFHQFGSHANLWIATERDAYVAYYRVLYYGSAYVNRSSNYSKVAGFSVRCVRD